jgi:hypothetical protein
VLLFHRMYIYLLNLQSFTLPRTCFELSLSAFVLLLLSQYALCSCMVHIKFTARPKVPVVSSEPELMASDKALDVSVQQLEASTQKAEQTLTN